MIAKETRDRYMRRADATHPGWEFAATSATPLRSTGTRSSGSGVSPLHRRSFQSAAYQQLASARRLDSRGPRQRVRTPPRDARAHEPCRRSKVTPIASKRSTGRMASGSGAEPTAAIRRTCSRLREWTDSNGVRPAAAIRLLTSRTRSCAVERDDVELAPAGPVVSLEDPEAEPDQVTGGVSSPVSPAVCGDCRSPRDATPRSRDTCATRRTKSVQVPRARPCRAERP